MKADVCVWPVWGLTPRWAAWLMYLVGGEPRDQHVALTFEDDTTLHLGGHGHSSKLVRYANYIDTFLFPSRRIGEFEVDPYAVASATGKQRSNLHDEIMYTLFSKEKGRWFKLFNMKQPTNCVTLTRDVLIASGYDINPTTYTPTELLKEIT